MRNCLGFLSHTYCQVKALGITYFVYPHIYGVGKVFLGNFLMIFSLT